MNSEIFENEIAAIGDADLQDFVRYYFNNYTPAYFWTVPASKTGRYHPVFAQGEGGLIRHTKAAFMVLEQLYRLSTYSYMSDELKDYGRAAILLHDTCKYGIYDDVDTESKSFAHHGPLAAAHVKLAWGSLFGSTTCPEYLLSAIRSHMGQWAEKSCRPFTPLDRVVHMADYISSFNLWDIPSLTTTEAAED